MTSVQQLFSLEGQTALVTGGTRGIGQAMAVALAEAGADVLLVQVCYVAASAGLQLADRIPARRIESRNKTSSGEARKEVANIHC